MMNSPNQTPASLATTVSIGKSRSRSAIHVVLAITAILIALLLGLIVLLLIGVETGPVALLIGLVAATLPVPLYVILVLWIDRYESEPLWMLLTAFFWGALVAVFFAFLINTASGVIVYALTDSLEAGEAFGAVISAPIVEECAKAVILFMFFFAKKDEFDGVVDGIVYASMVGLGFAMTENIQYYGRAALQGGGGGLTVIFIIRGMMAPFSHPLFTSMVGIGLGLARQSHNTLVKIAAPIVGLLGAISLHAIWNGSAVMGGGLVFILTYFGIMVPAFFIMILVIFLALRREGRTVREFLLADLNGGFLTPEEYNQLCTVRGRMGASYNAFSRGGVGSWRACMQFNQMASELAFHRSRVARGILLRGEAPEDREAAYQRALLDLQKILRLS
ncbi:MAG TPA: PrsW family intramembrane metalloprotease [Pyrinomonadaceae bacterium]|nr:PrsW family intramembrane metalloprotease [Pyrinomonadaceae bacterium]